MNLYTITGKYIKVRLLFFHSQMPGKWRLDFEVHEFLRGSCCLLKVFYGDHKGAEDSK